MPMFLSGGRRYGSLSAAMASPTVRRAVSTPFRTAFWAGGRKTWEVNREAFCSVRDHRRARGGLPGLLSRLVRRIEYRPHREQQGRRQPDRRYGQGEIGRQ